MSLLSGSIIFKELLVPQLHLRFRRATPSAARFEEFVQSRNGDIVLDHGATRVTDPKAFAFIGEIAGAFGLKPAGEYHFPDKKLKSIAYHPEDDQGFKWFSSLVEIDKFSKETQQAILEDHERCPLEVSPLARNLLTPLTNGQGLSEDDAQSLVNELLTTCFTRPHPPLKKSTYHQVLQESSEAVNALLLGAGFNHLGYLVNGLDIKEWYGTEVIEVLVAVLEDARFNMLGEIAGEAGSILRQTSIKADLANFPVENEAGEVEMVENPSRFVELVKRGPARDTAGNIIVREGHIKLFSGFLGPNAEKIFESTHKAKS